MVALEKEGHKMSYAEIVRELLEKSLEQSKEKDREQRLLKTDFDYGREVLDFAIKARRRSLIDDEEYKIRRDWAENLMFS